MMFECELRVWESMPCYRTPPRRASRAASFRVIVIIIKSTEIPRRASSYKYHEYKWNKNQTQVQNFPCQVPCAPEIVSFHSWSSRSFHIWSWFSHGDMSYVMMTLVFTLMEFDYHLPDKRFSLAFYLSLCEGRGAFDTWERSLPYNHIRTRKKMQNTKNTGKTNFKI